MLAIAGGKGGAGKTTTALGLGQAIVRNGGRPVIVDLDVDMPDLHDVAGAVGSPGFDALAAGEAVEAVVQRDHDLPGVGIVPAGSDGERERALRRSRQAGSRTLLDCPAGAGPDAATPMALADRTLVVATPTRQSLADAAKTAAMSRALETPVAGLVVRERAASVSVSRSDLSAIVDAPVRARVPHADGEPLVDHGVRRSMERLRRELFGRNSGPADTGVTGCGDRKRASPSSSGPSPDKRYL